MVLLAQSVILSDVLFAVLEMNDTQLFARGRQSHLSNASESSGLSHNFATGPNYISGRDGNPPGRQLGQKAMLVRLVTRAAPTATNAAPLSLCWLLGWPHGRCISRRRHLHRPRQLQAESIPKHALRWRGRQRDCKAVITVDFEPMRRATARRGRHGQHSNSLLCAMAPRTDVLLHLGVRTSF